MKLTRAQAQKMGLITHTESSVSKEPRPKNDGQKGGGDKLFLKLCEVHGLPPPVPEYPWATSIGRKWRFDWLFDGWLAVEVQGGVWIRGHHSRGQDQVDDMDKRNRAVIEGFSVLEFVPQQIEDGSAFAVIAEALGAKEEQS